MDEPSIKKCPECGASLPPGAMLGLCPRCLMARGREAGSLAEGGDDTVVSNIPHSPPSGRRIETEGSTVGRYKLLQKIGEGGFGVVFMAEQREPIERRVALKIIKEGMDTKQVIARFEAERQALALMDHPNIAKVLDAGATEAGRPYFVMELVKGEPITAFCDKRKYDLRRRLSLFMDVCSAVQHAHQKGIIHRDLKPSNILVGLEGDRCVAKVIDFGIAKATEQQLTDKTVLTHFEQFIGTPAYISPEQAEISAIDIDTRADIYSLGVILYEMLTGKLPLDLRKLQAAGIDEVRRLIRETEAPKPSTRFGKADEKETEAIAHTRRTEPGKLGRFLKGDLDWIVLKALEKDRTRRYESATTLRDDLERFLNDEPVLAAAPSPIYFFSKFARRHKGAIAAAAAIVMALAGGTVVSTWQAIKARQAETRETEQRENAEAANRKAQERLRMLARSDWVRAKELLAARPPRQREAFAYLARACRTDENFTFPVDTAVLALNNWQVRTPVQSFPLARDGAYSVRFSPDGGRVVAGRKAFPLASAHAIPLQEGHPALSKWVGKRTGHPLDQIPSHEMGQLRESWLFNSRFSPDGSKIVTGTSYGHCLVWDSRSGEVLAVLEDPGNHPIQSINTTRAEFSPNGSRILTCREGSLENRDFRNDIVHARLWDAENGALLSTLGGSGDAGDPVLHARYSPNGTRILTTHMDGAARLWDSETMEPLRTFDSSSEAAVDAAFDRKGERLLTVSRDKTVRVWSVSTGDELCPALERHSGRITSASFSPDGRFILTTSEDRTAILLNAPDKNGTEKLLPLSSRIIPHRQSVAGGFFSPDGLRFFTVSARTVFLWENGSASQIAQFEGIWHRKGQRSPVHVDARGRHLVTLLPRRKVDRRLTTPEFAQLWEVENQQLGATIPIPMQRGRKLRNENLKFTAGGTITVYSFGSRIWLTDNKRGRILDLIRLKEKFCIDAFVDGNNYRLLVSKGAKKPPPPYPIAIVMGSHGKDPKTVELQSEDTPQVKMARFSPDGKRFVTLSNGEDFGIIWSTEEGLPLATLERTETQPSRLRFDRGGSLIIGEKKATGSNLGAVWHWDASDGSLLFHQIHPPSRSPEGAFDREGNRFVLIQRESDSGWRAIVRGYSPGPELVLSGHKEPIEDARFSPDGKWFITTSQDRTGRVWNSHRGTLVSLLKGFERPDIRTFFSRDGHRIVTASFTGVNSPGKIKIWDTATGSELSSLPAPNNGFWRAANVGNSDRMVTFADGHVQLWETAGSLEGVPGWWIDFLTFLGGKRFNEKGEMFDLPVFVSGEEEASERESRKTLHRKLTRAIEGDDSRLAEIARWFLKTPRSSRPALLGQTETAAEMADQLIRPGALRQNLERAFDLDPLHPLIHLALARVVPGAAIDRDARAQREFLRAYSLLHLPDDAALRKRAESLDPNPAGKNRKK